MRFLLIAPLLLVGCGDDQPSLQGVPPFDAAVPRSPSDGAAGHDASAVPDAAVAHDGGAPADLGASDGATPPSGDGGSFMPHAGPDDPVAHAQPTAIAMTRLSGAGLVYDVGVDRGGGVWAVAPGTVYYWPKGGGDPFTYSQANGLARGNGANVFASVGGGNAGQAIVGNRGAIADVLTVNPQSGAIVSINNMVVPFSNDPEYPEHLVRVVAGIRVAVDLDGTWHGTGYVGGTHGFVAWHGLDADCGCEQFQEHQHFIPGQEFNWCDSTNPPTGCWGGDVKGLALSPEGDVWAGDEHFVALMPQRSLGPFTDFFQNFTVAVDVFPKADDEVSSLAVDGSGAVWVASFGQGLARLAPMTHQPSYFDRSGPLPMNRLTAVAVDGDGSLWVGTFLGGVARMTNAGWVYYTAGSGLPGDDVTSITIDRNASPRRVYIGTTTGVGVYTGP